MKAWQPPESPLRIEFPDDLLTQLDPDPSRIETTGLLFGRREAASVQILWTEKDADHAAEAVGIYIVRERGEVFLTEANLALFEGSRVPVVLVIAGAKAGFFVRDSNGALQCVRSFEEISIPRSSGSGFVVAMRNKWRLAAAFLLVAILPVAGLAYLQPHHAAAPPGLSVREAGDQLLISWKPGRPGILEISDGGHRTSVRILPRQSTTTYVRRYGDVQITVTLLDR